jgi:hypothetical protein
MKDHQDQPLQIGETVRYNHHHNAGTDCTGTIVGRLREDCLRVLWSDMQMPTTHHSYSLARVRTKAAAKKSGIG